MSFERAKAHLRKLGYEQAIITLQESSATVELAAQALGCAPERIAKSLTFRLPDGPVMIVMAGDAKLDNRKYKDRFGSKAVMLSPQEVEEQIGHSIGGVCPFGVNEGVRIYLDASLQRFDTVYPACGSGNTCVLLTLEALYQASGCPEWVDVGKGWQA